MCPYVELSLIFFVAGDTGISSGVESGHRGAGSSEHCWGEDPQMYQPTDSAHHENHQWSGWVRPEGFLTK